MHRQNFLADLDSMNLADSDSMNLANLNGITLAAMVFQLIFAIVMPIAFLSFGIFLVATSSYYLLGAVLIGSAVSHWAVVLFAALPPLGKIEVSTAGILSAIAMPAILTTAALALGVFITTSLSTVAAVFCMITVCSSLLFIAGSMVSCYTLFKGNTAQRSFDVHPLALETKETNVRSFSSSKTTLPLQDHILISNEHHGDAIVEDVQQDRADFVK